MRIRGAVVTGIVAALAVLGVLYAFVANASPYVTVAQAKGLKGDSLHLAGDILKETLVNDVANGQIRFDLRDDEGSVVNVLYSGPAPANMGEATKVVAIGSMRDDTFHSHKLLVKCPSKYEGEQGGDKKGTY